MIIKFNAKYYCISVFIGIVGNAVSMTALAVKYPSITETINIGLLLLLVLQIFRIVYKLRNKKEIILWLLGFALMFYSYRVSKSRVILELYVYVTGAVDVDYKKILLSMKKAWIFALSCIVGLALIGIIPSNVGYRENGSIRLSLGFAHANSLGFILFTICSLYFIEKYKKLTWNNVAVITLMTVATYLVTNSRTSSLLMMILMIVAYMKKIGLNAIRTLFKSKIVRLIMILSIIGLLAFSIWSAVNYDIILKLAQLNKLMNNRVSNGAYYFSLYSPTLTGQQIPEFTLYTDNFTRLYLDNGYLLLLLRNGIFSTFIYMLLLIKAVSRAVREKNMETAVVLLALACSVFVEQTALRWCFCGVFMYAFANTQEIKKSQTIFER